MYERIPRKAKLPHVEMSSEILVQDMDYFVQSWFILFAYTSHSVKMGIFIKKKHYYDNGIFTKSRIS